jgi:hypothetical protein
MDGNPPGVLALTLKGNVVAVRIIEGVPYQSKSAPWWDLKAHDLGNGHIEVTGKQGTELVELDWSKEVLRDHLEMLALYHEEHAEEIARERREKSLRVAANRAKTRVRKLCKAMGADTLLTLTYRANQTGLDLCKVHLKEFVRRMRRLMPDFRAVCGFEKQTRGAWHVHMATVRLPADLPARNGVKVKSFNVIRAVWRSVTKDYGGNIDVSAKKRNSERSAARIASYISKYITKAFEEGEKWVNRWTKFGDVDLPKPMHLGRYDSEADMIREACRVATVEHVDTMFRSHFGDWFYLALERPPQARKGPIAGASHATLH